MGDLVEAVIWMSLIGMLIFGVVLGVMTMKGLS